jgi:hypothetical protein
MLELFAQRVRNQRLNDVPPGNVFYNFIYRMTVLNITLRCSPIT